MSSDELRSSTGGKAPVTLSQYKMLQPPPDDGYYSDSSDFEDDVEETTEERMRRFAVEAVQGVGFEIAREAAREAVRVFNQHKTSKPKRRPPPSESPRPKRQRSDSPGAIDANWKYTGRAYERLDAALKETHKQRARPNRATPDWLTYAETMGEEGPKAILDRNAWNTASRMMTYVVDEALLNYWMGSVKPLQDRLADVPIETVCQILAACREAPMDCDRLRLIVGEELWHSTGLANIMPKAAPPPAPPASVEPIDELFEPLPEVSPDVPSTQPPSPMLPDDPIMELLTPEPPAEIESQHRPLSPTPGLPKPDLPQAGELRVMGPPSGLPEPPPTPARPTEARPLSLAAMAQ